MIAKRMRGLRGARWARGGVAWDREGYYRVSLGVNSCGGLAVGGVPLRAQWRSDWEGSLLLLVRLHPRVRRPWASERSSGVFISMNLWADGIGWRLLGEQQVDQWRTW